jgi:hypothetical protein
MPNFLPASINYTSRDYLTIKAGLVSHVQSYYPNDWSDFLESNLGIALLELIAWVGDNLSFYLDRTANEAFLRTAQQRRSVVDLVRLIGYAPRTAAAASVPVAATLQVAQAAPTTIPAYTLVTDADGVEFEFLANISVPAGLLTTQNQPVTDEVLVVATGTDNSYVLETANPNLTVGSATLKFTISSDPYEVLVRNDGTILLPFSGAGTLDYSTGELVLVFAVGSVPDAATNVTLTYQWTQQITAYQGRTFIEYFSSDGTSSLEFTLSRFPALVPPLVDETPPSPDPSRFEVWIGSPGAPFGAAAGAQWTRVDAIVLSDPTDEAYEVIIEDDRIKVRFGDDSAGRIPPVGANNIGVIYRAGGGLKGNISTGFLDTNVTGSSGSSAVTVGLRNYQAGTGGSERETLDEIRVNAPRTLKTNDTATTEEDYDTLSTTFSQPGLGTIARAKSRLTPAASKSVKTVFSGLTLGTSGAVPTTTYNLLLPGAPIVLSTVTVSYTVGGTVRNVTATDLGSGLADLTGDASIDSATTRFRYDQHDWVDDAPAGWVGDAATLSFGPDTLQGPPVHPATVVVKYTIDGTDYIGYDDGAGALVGTHIDSGSITYTSGSVSITFASGKAPDLGFNISFSYQSTLHLALNSAPTAGTNIIFSGDTGPAVVSIPTNNIEVYTWAFDANQNLVPPNVATRTNLKAFLDVRRVLGTSIEIKSGYNIQAHIYLAVTFDPAVSQTETEARVQAALETYFLTIGQVDAGTDIPLAALYDQVYPLQGVTNVVIQDIALRVPVGTGDGATIRFEDDVTRQAPATFVSLGKLPMLPGVGKILVFKGGTQIGASDAGDPIAALAGSGLISGSSVNIDTGEFTLRLTSAPAVDELVSLEFFLDEQSAISGVQLWNLVIDEWEIAVLGDLFVNSTKIN